MLLYGVTATVLVAAVVTGITATFCRRRRDVPTRRVLVVAAVGAALGLVLSLVIEDPWSIWRAVVMEAAVAVFGVVVALTRTDPQRSPAR